MRGLWMFFNKIQVFKFTQLEIIQLGNKIYLNIFKTKAPGTSWKFVANFWGNSYDNFMTNARENLQYFFYK